MAQLIVRNIEETVVRQLKLLAVAHVRSAEEKHREILRRALVPEPTPVPDFKTLLESIPQGDDDLFERIQDYGRTVEL